MYVKTTANKCELPICVMHDSNVQCYTCRSASYQTGPSQWSEASRSRHNRQEKITPLNPALQWWSGSRRTRRQLLPSKMWPGIPKSKMWSDCWGWYNTPPPSHTEPNFGFRKYSVNQVPYGCGEKRSLRGRDNFDNITIGGRTLSLM